MLAPPHGGAAGQSRHVLDMDGELSLGEARGASDFGLEEAYSVETSDDDRVLYRA